jgi:hypothetical protein
MDRAQEKRDSHAIRYGVRVHEFLAKPENQDYLLLPDPFDKYMMRKSGMTLDEYQMLMAEMLLDRYHLYNPLQRGLEEMAAEIRSEANYQQESSEMQGQASANVGGQMGTGSGYHSPRPMPPAPNQAQVPQQITPARVVADEAAGTLGEMARIKEQTTTIRSQLASTDPRSPEHFEIANALVQSLRYYAELTEALLTKAV